MPLTEPGKPGEELMRRWDQIRKSTLGVLRSVGHESEKG